MRPRMRRERACEPRRYCIQSTYPLTCWVVCHSATSPLAAPSVATGQASKRSTYQLHTSTPPLSSLLPGRRLSWICLRAIVIYYNNMPVSARDSSAFITLCDTLMAVFGRYTDLLSADMAVRIIHRSADFYIVTNI